MYAEQEDEAKENNSEMSDLEKRYQEIIVTIKKAAAKKRKEAHDTRIDVKNTAAAAEAESTLVGNVAQETEGRSKKRSSKDDEQRGTAAASAADSALLDTVLLETEGGIMMRSSEADIPRDGYAHLEHRRPDGWTSTFRGKDDDEASSQPLVRTGGEGAHDNIKSTGCGSSCDLRAGSDCQNNAHSVTNILKAVWKNILLHKSFLRSKRQVPFQNQEQGTEADRRTAGLRR